jgi:hypothetical protein
LKRFAAIVTIVVVVLAMSAGTAFASVCVGMTCSTQAMVCSESASTSCPMENGAAMAHASCGHQLDRGARDAVSGQVGPEYAVVGTPIAVLPADTVVRGLASMLPASDARGAPHLTTVIRI